MQTFMQNPEMIPWVVVGLLLLGGLFFLVRSGAKKIGDSEIKTIEKRRLVGGAGLLLMLLGPPSAGSGIGFLNQEGIRLFSLGGAGVGGGVALLLVGIILLAIACNWDFGRNDRN